MLEKQVEKARARRAKTDHGLSLKFVSPGRRNVPDRIELRPIPPEYRELVARFVWFEEAKAPKKDARAAQKREHDRYRKLGFVVLVPDSVDGE